MEQTPEDKSLARLSRAELLRVTKDRLAENAAMLERMNSRLDTTSLQVTRALLFAYRVKAQLNRLNNISAEVTLAQARQFVRVKAAGEAYAQKRGPSICECITHVDDGHGFADGDYIRC